MGLFRSKERSVVGLDIESGFIAAAATANGTGSGLPVLAQAATHTLGPGLFHDGEVVDANGLAEHLRAFFREHKLPKRVRLGLANQRIVVRVLELPAIADDQELEAAVRFQAQEELPLPLEQAVLDHRVLERYTDGESPKMRVLVVAARRDSVENLLAATRKASLAPELVDLSAFAMVRALYVPPPASGPDGAEGGGAGGEAGGVTAGGAVAETNGTNRLATLYCYVGGVTNLAIAVGTTCVFNRVLPNALESMAATLAERKGLTLEHARQWLQHVGLERDTGGMEGDAEILAEARQVLQRGSARIADDVRLSMEYYAGAVPDARRVERVVMAGPGIAIEGAPAALEAELGIPVEPRSLGQIDVTPGVLDGVEGSQLTIATGLALDEVRA